jgi:hypothetical protein
LFTHIPHYPFFGKMSHDDRLFVTAPAIAVSAFLRGGEFLVHWQLVQHRVFLQQREVQVIDSTSPNKCVDVPEKHVVA